MAMTLTTDALGTLSDKLDDLALLFLGDELDDRRKKAYVDTFCAFRAFPLTFEKLCIALDRTKERWEQAGRMPTPKFILDTIDPRY